MSHHSLPLIAGDKIDKRKVSKTRFPISINKKKIIEKSRDILDVSQRRHQCVLVLDLSGDWLTH